MTAPTCSRCGNTGDLKQGWTMAYYCCENCERLSVAELHDSMPGRPSPYYGWIPNDVKTQIQRRWWRDAT
jgi:hypothetical protein